MSTRTYDYKLFLKAAQNFTVGLQAIGNTSETSGEIIFQDLANNLLKVKVNNLVNEYEVGEFVHCNVIQTTGTTAAGVPFSAIQFYSNAATTTVNGNNFIINGATNTFALPTTTDDGESATDFANLNASEITVKVDGIPLRKDLIIYPSTNALNGLGRAGFDIVPFIFEPGEGLISIKTDSEGRGVGPNGQIVDAANTQQKFIDAFEQRERQVPVNRDKSGRIRTGGKGQQLPGFATETFDVAVRNVNNNFVTVATFPQSKDANLSVRIVSGNTESVPYNAPVFLEQNTIAVTKLLRLDTSGFVRIKNAFEQPPLVRLYDIFYPGEWFPANGAGNPTGEGDGLAWPFGFPYRFAEVRGDTISDISYRAYYDGDSYLCYPIDSGGIGLSQSGEVNQTSVKIANFDSLIAQIVEDPFLVGNCANAAYGTVNFEILGNLDPYTIPTNALFDQDVVDSDYAGTVNAAITYGRCSTIGGIWVPGKADSRDLLGGVVRIKSTFANFLDYWPEYSSILSLNGNVVELYSTAPYRIGDNVTIKGSRGNHANVVNIVGNFIETSVPFSNVGLGTPLFIVNPDADTDAYVEDVFKVDQLQSLNGAFAEFNLTSWLQYFKLSFPRRKYYKNTCPWIYKGEECQYPSDGTGLIPGTSGETVFRANGFFTDKNVSVDTVKANDVCAKSFVACKLRNNQIHFGGFIGTGRTIPQG
jgi:phage-related protein